MDSEPEHEEEEEQQDLGRKQKRKMYLRVLRDLVPQLQHPALPEETLPSGHFSLLASREKGNKMPFPPEVFDVASKSATV